MDDNDRISPALEMERCGDVLAPIPGERWECVAAHENGADPHVARDGTTW